MCAGVLFDAGNTLVHIDTLRVVEIYAAVGHSIEVEAFDAAEAEARRVLHEGFGEGGSGMEEHVWGEYFQDLFARTDVPTDARQPLGEGILAEHGRDHLWTRPHAGTVEALTALTDAGYRIGVISNADGRMEACLRRAGLRDHFEFVIDSGQVGFEKPAPEIFHAGCEALGMAPDECAYIGDLYPVDYVGSTRAGLHGVLLDPLGVHAERAPIVSALGDLPDWLRAST